MNRKAKIASVVSLVAVFLVMVLIVFAAPKKCNNNVDDDNDGLKDYPNDPGCSSATDNDEHSSSLVCDNGLDETNDRDSLADYRLSGGDPGCTSATDTSEVDGQCDDLADNDADGYIDYPSDPECNNFADLEYDCTDTDGGQAYTVKGTVSGSFGGVPFNDTDFCVNSTNLVEFYCIVFKSQNVTHNCANITTQCVNGACV